MSKMMMGVLTALIACAVFGGQEALSMDLSQLQRKKNQPDKSNPTS